MAYIQYFYTLNIKSYLLLIFLTNFYALSQLATSHTKKKKETEKRTERNSNKKDKEIKFNLFIIL